MSKSAKKRPMASAPAAVPTTKSSHRHQGSHAEEKRGRDLGRNCYLVYRRLADHHSGRPLLVLLRILAVSQRSTTVRRRAS